jgi:hypothetical protein
MSHWQFGDQRCRSGSWIEAGGSKEQWKGSLTTVNDVGRTLHTKSRERAMAADRYVMDYA